jgi:hypothetical protein
MERSKPFPRTEALAEQLIAENIVKGWKAT